MLQGKDTQLIYTQIMILDGCLSPLILLLTCRGIRNITPRCHEMCKTILVYIVQILTVVSYSISSGGGIQIPWYLVAKNHPQEIQ